MGKTRASRTQLNTRVIGSLVLDSNFSLVNISDSGALVLTSHKMVLGDLYFLDFNFICDNKKLGIKIKSRVVRVSLKCFLEDDADKKTPIYEVGLTFLHDNEKDVKNLKMMIAQKELSRVRQ